MQTALKGGGRSRPQKHPEEEKRRESGFGSFVLDPWFLLASSLSLSLSVSLSLSALEILSRISVRAFRSPPFLQMTTMSDDGDRTCPLCAEEMDLTDQQLKPCKCGYEICVWCWHHIMEMAEKEETEGRCPACRTAYDKDRIVKMAANCERMVAEINAEKKQKPQKVKPKTSADARKHLSSVRVIQRNLVYIIGLPNNLMDESLLERREYFGQYGKVMKVSISRPTGAAAQQALANNTFSVYITYSKEEEAIRCIQSVHNFALEGKSLRACFGTTKYCHQWLRSLSCNNPDCLYLHDIGSQEDSFTKDEIISAYTRSRVPQIVMNASQRRVGNVLPPPADDFSNSTVAVKQPPLKNGSNYVPSQTKVSPPNSSAGKSTLPAAAAWGLRNINSRQAASSSVAPLQTLAKSKSEGAPSINIKPQTPSAWHDDVATTSSSSKLQLEQTDRSSKSFKPAISKELNVDLSSIPSAWNDDPVVITPPSYEDGKSDKTSGTFPQSSHNPSFEASANSSSIASSPSGVDERDSIVPASFQSVAANGAFADVDTDDLTGRLSSVCLDTDGYPVESASGSTIQVSRQDGTKPMLKDVVGENLLSTSDQILGPFDSSYRNSSWNDEAGPAKYDPLALRDNSSILPNAHQGSELSGSGLYNKPGIFHSLGVNNTEKVPSVNKEESSIISDILALDFDPWDESSSLPNSLAAPWRCKSTGQSRFLFARQDGRGDFLEGSMREGGSDHRFGMASQNSYQNGLGFESMDGSNGFARSGSGFGSDRIAANSRTKVSAPPGFSAPSRVVPPPGFSSHDRSSNHLYDTSYSDNRLLDNIPAGNHYQQANLTRNSSDIEFIDPAILAVGKGRMAGLSETVLDQKPVPASSYLSNFSASPTNSDPRIQLLMQQALSSSNQNPRMIPDHHVRDPYLSLSDSVNGNFGASRFMAQNFAQVSPHQQQRSSHLTNGGQWDGWSDLRMGGNMGMNEMLRNERIMLNGNNLYAGEENNFHLPGSDIYNRAFGL
ncbi:hypothetical protein LUZ63_012840 [Rhynchospora breviuscula]|uniref:CCR4-NOT transcription complex subunit 4 n=1 Tax=Rhynchospora breviuscula TaxID=2022672 RepID=A0A9Q0C7L9_9POAL|nr:hypothetical protein LUZ63_012840 [Rhynchospora breviuscula]